MQFGYEDMTDISNESDSSIILMNEFSGQNEMTKRTVEIKDT